MWIHSSESKCLLYHLSFDLVMQGVSSQETADIMEALSKTNGESDALCDSLD